MEFEVSSIENMDQLDEPLTIVASAKGALGTNDGARIVTKADLFEALTSPRFQPQTRQLPIYLPARELIRDAIRINFPASFRPASLPADLTLSLKDAATYKFATESTPTSVTIRRDYALGRIDYSAQYYNDVRTFFSKMTTKDQEPIVLEAASSAGQKQSALGHEGPAKE